MDFQTAITEDMQVTISDTGEFARELTLKPRGGEERSAYAIIHFGENYEDRYASRQDIRRVAEIQMMRAELTDLDHGFKFKIDGEWWEYVRVLRSTNLLMDIEIEKDIRPTLKR